MTDTTTETGADVHPSPTAPKRSFLSQLEIDTRLLGMIGAFILVCLVFNVLTDGRFLQILPNRLQTGRDENSAAHRTNPPNSVEDFRPIRTHRAKRNLLVRL